MTTEKCLSLTEEGKVWSDPLPRILCDGNSLSAQLSDQACQSQDSKNWGLGMRLASGWAGTGTGVQPLAGMLWEKCVKGRARPLTQHHLLHRHLTGPHFCQPLHFTDIKHLVIYVQLSLPRLDLEHHTYLLLVQLEYPESTEAKPEEQEE